MYRLYFLLKCLNKFTFKYDNHKRVQFSTLFKHESDEFELKKIQKV